MSIRLQKHIADLGICSRRKAEVLIAEGKVKVNGDVVTELGTKVDPDADTVEVEGAGTIATASGEKVYILLHKPVDYICSASSEQGATVLDLLKKENNIKPKKFGRDITERVYPVGRLDKDSEGLVLLTNDGELTNMLTHPRYEHEKEYDVTIDSPLSADARAVLTGGMELDDGEWVNGIEIKNVVKKGGRRNTVTVVLKEGKNRQIRRMFGRLGYQVLSLKRTRMCNLTIGVLPVGKWRFVKKDQIV